ncbi:MAG: serpin family protein [Tannerellaceae bacterium]|nr:serpin family protein [Tannerellaceae bacterium]
MPAQGIISGRDIPVAKSFLILLLTALSLASCSKDNPPIVDNDPLKPWEETPETPETNTPSFADNDFQLTPTEKKIVSVTNRFAFNLLGKMLETEDANKNMLISPLSASVALSMLNNGAAGATREEILAGLGFADMPAEEVNAYFKKMLAAMNNTDARVAFETANSIWIKNNFTVLDSFKNTNMSFYDAEVRNVDLLSSMNIINEWVAQKTHNTIPQLLDEPLGEMTLMVILNALYFKAPWTFPFKKEDTKDETFHNADSSTIKAPTMYIKEQFYYYNYRYLSDGSRFYMLDLPYGSQNFKMKIFLPYEGASVDSVAQYLSGRMTELNSAVLPRGGLDTVIVKLPRFHVEYKTELNEQLTALGMKSMFDINAANFSLINPAAPIYVSRVLQKTFVEVNEEGTEASAATEIDAVGTFGGEEPGPPPVYEFFVDRPFMFAIVEKKTDCIFFIGIIRNLSE